MAEIEFKFSSTPMQDELHASYLEKMDCEIHYSKDGESGKLQASICSPRLKHENGERTKFSLDFNAIGSTNPLAFLESLDEGYLNDKVSGLGSRKYDLFKTIANVRSTADDADYELTAAQRIGVEEMIDNCAAGFDGDHEIHCRSLLGALSRMGIPCFEDDVYHMVGFRRTPQNLVFHLQVWPEFLEAFEAHLDANYDLLERIDAIVEGREPVLEDEDIKMEF